MRIRPTKEVEKLFNVKIQWDYYFGVVKINKEVNEISSFTRLISKNRRIIQ